MPMLSSKLILPFSSLKLTALHLTSQVASIALAMRGHLDPRQGLHTGNEIKHEILFASRPAMVMFFLLLRSLFHKNNITKRFQNRNMYIPN